MGRIVDIWTDGSGNNPGSVGWAAILTRKGRSSLVVGGFAEESTVNRAETMGAIQALEALKVPSKVNIYTDSRYVSFGIKRLQRNSKLGTNMDLWERMRPLIKKHKVTVIWVRGHGIDPINNLVDAFADYAWREQTEINEYIEDITPLLVKPDKRVKELFKLKKQDSAYAT